MTLYFGYRYIRIVPPFNFFLLITSWLGCQACQIRVSVCVCDLCVFLFNDPPKTKLKKTNPKITRKKISHYVWNGGDRVGKINHTDLNNPSKVTLKNSILIFLFFCCYLTTKTIQNDLLLLLLCEVKKMIRVTFEWFVWSSNLSIVCVWVFFDIQLFLNWFFFANSKRYEIFLFQKSWNFIMMNLRKNWQILSI